jgi:hypothetical protein
MATSTGPKKGEFTQPKMEGARPADTGHSTAKQPQKLPLPAGKQNPDNMPRERTT